MVRREKRTVREAGPYIRSRRSVRREAGKASPKGGVWFQREEKRTAGGGPLHVILRSSLRS